MHALCSNFPHPSQSLLCFTLSLATLLDSVLYRACYTSCKWLCSCLASGPPLQPSYCAGAAATVDGQEPKGLSWIWTGLFWHQKGKGTLKYIDEVLRLNRPEVMCLVLPCRCAVHSSQDTCWCCILISVCIFILCACYMCASFLRYACGLEFLSLMHPYTILVSRT